MVFWQENWARTRERFAAWWCGEGLILSVTAPLTRNRLDGVELVPKVGFAPHSGVDIKGTYAEPVDLETAWLDAERRARVAEIGLGGTYFGGESFPYFDTHIGPGSLALWLGSPAKLMTDTVWYEPCITDPENHPPLVFDPDHPWFLKQKALITAGLKRAAGRYLVGMPDLVEGLDTLISLREVSVTMMDAIERPEWIAEQVMQINQVYFETFDALYELIRDAWGGNAFSAFNLWGPGKTAKVQCDAAALISPRMFKRFAVPQLTAQCDWLDYAMYHLDGTQAINKLDALLEIEPLQAIEWTPQAGIESGGDPRWYDMYNKILAAGKSVQAVGVEAAEVIPLLDACGGAGMFIITRTDTEEQARRLEEQVEAYR